MTTVQFLRLILDLTCGRRSHELKRGWVAITVLAALMTGADGPKFHVHPERNCKLVSC